MNHAITIGGLLSGIAILAGLFVGMAGCFAFMAGAMSDAPAEGDKAGSAGCVMMLIGVASLIATGIWICA